MALVENIQKGVCPEWELVVPSTNEVPIVELTGKVEKMDNEQAWRLDQLFKLLFNRPKLAAYCEIIGNSTVNEYGRSTILGLRARGNGNYNAQQLQATANLGKVLNLLQDNDDPRSAIDLPRLANVNNLVSFLLAEESFAYTYQLFNYYTGNTNPDETSRQLSRFYALTIGYPLSVLPVMYRQNFLKDDNTIAKLPQDPYRGILQAQGCFGRAIVTDGDRATIKPIQKCWLKVIAELGWIRPTDDDNDIQELIEVISSQLFDLTSSGKNKTPRLTVKSLAGLTTNLHIDRQAAKFITGLYENLWSVLQLAPADETILGIRQQILKEHQTLVGMLAKANSQHE